VFLKFEVLANLKAFFFGEPHKFTVCKLFTYGIEVGICEIILLDDMFGIYDFSICVLGNVFNLDIGLWWLG
jgi:hypothetical protein